MSEYKTQTIAQKLNAIYYRRKSMETRTRTGEMTGTGCVLPEPHKVTSATVRNRPHGGDLRTNVL